jgi:prepilin peptidase CpaA
VLEIICELSIALFAVAYDLKYRKIPNRLCLYGVLSGLLLAFIGVSGVTPLQSLGGIVIPVFTLWVLFVIRALGAGDIKLLCAIGAFAGPDICKIVCLSMIYGAVAGVVALIWKLFTNKKDEHIKFGTKVCFSVPIALGLLTFVIREVICGGI